ncbi:MAG: hypothetical protein IT373_01990 [Polyangiaceae bacterium]|nr:hypothetical protein [Polyangiaceae bacterium]
MNDDELFLALSDGVPELAPALAQRVRRLAHATLRPAPGTGTGLTLPAALRGAVVPALLASAAVVRTAQTVETARVLFGGEEPVPSADDPAR